jgi:SAM-dependent methyltransferase
MATVTPDAIFQVATGFMAAKHLFVANEVGLFAHLTLGPTTLDTLAQRTGVPRRTLRMLADAMVALGFVEKQGEYYQNGPVAATFLSGGTPTDLRPFLRFWNQLSYPRWMQLEAAVRTDQVLFGFLEFTDEQQRIFSEGVAVLTSGTAQALATAYDFGRHRRVLDLGGGTGSFLVALLSRYSGLAATLFEMPSAAAVARQHLASTPYAGRITVVAGDFFTDVIPAGHDAILIANVVHGYVPDRIHALFQRLRTQVPEGARLLLVDWWTDPTHTQPLFAALMAAEFLINGGGDVYSAEEIREWLHETGWRLLEQVPVEGPASVIVAETAAS